MRVEEEGLPEERTALAWERTAISTMLIGLLIARYATQSLHWTFGVVGLVVVAAGGCLLVWAESRYEELQSATGNSVHPTAVRVVGLLAVVLAGLAMLVAIAIAFDS
jgi:uncharacterized membrane protein YidH (DUF202 family)